MFTTTVILIILAAIVSLAFAVLQYGYGASTSHRYSLVLAGIRGITIFAVLLLLLNPKFSTTHFYNEKPNLLLLVDNSASINNLEAVDEVSQIVESLSTHSGIRERFDLQIFTFGETLEENNQFSFSESQTNIHGALRSLGKLFENELSPTVLITDGNQTFGRAYEFSAQNYENPLFPIVVGDTAVNKDISLSRINVNRYSFLNNQFPVELIINYTGSEALATKVQISSGSRVYFSEDIVLSKSNSSIIVEGLLPATSIGLSTYKAEVLPVPDEKNIFNNEKNFAVEVIDERTSVLILASIIHPDLGALKKSIETNQQREAVIRQVDEPRIALDDYELVILYQPSAKFNSYYEELKQKGSNYLVVTGPQTDWQFFNQLQDEFQKNIIPGQTEEYFPSLNKNFSSFQLVDFGFSELPPLEDVFGEIETNNRVQTILFQQIKGIETSEPLLATVEEQSTKKAFLFGANIWQWRAQTFAQEESFEGFDNFIGKLVQFLSSSQGKERLSVNYENFYYSNEKIVVSAQYFDENYTFDPHQQLNLEIKDEDNELTQLIPFSSIGNKYEIELSNLEAAAYTFQVKVEGESLSRSGSFTVVGSDVEKQFLNSDLERLQLALKNREETLFFPDQMESLQEQLLTDKKYVPLQKSQQNNVPLIDWFYLLGIIVLSLSTEWFLRKYYGLV